MSVLYCRARVQNTEDEGKDCAFVQGDFKVRHPHCHTIADMAGVVGGSILREITGILYVIGFMMVRQAVAAACRVATESGV